jgi:hypothetical protein
LKNRIQEEKLLDFTFTKKRIFFLKDFFNRTCWCVQKRKSFYCLKITSRFRRQQIKFYLIFFFIFRRSSNVNFISDSRFFKNLDTAIVTHSRLMVWRQVQQLSQNISKKKLGHHMWTIKLIRWKSDITPRKWRNPVVYKMRICWVEMEITIRHRLRIWKTLTQHVETMII